jgi:hypothetical protein
MSEAEGRPHDVNMGGGPHASNRRVVERINTISDLIEVVRDKPHMYLPRESLTEMSALIDGWRLAVHEYRVSLPQEVPPWGQFAYWISRRFEKDASMGWWLTILQASADGPDALREFFKLLDEFRKGRLVLTGSVRLSNRLAPTGSYRLCCGDRDLTWVMPEAIELSQYSLDLGCYVAYRYAENLRAPHYLPTLEAAIDRVRQHFRAEREDWEFVQQLSR